MALSKPAAIFFDWDGTLVDSFSFLEAAHNHVLAAYGRAQFEKGGFRQYFGKPREEIYPAVYGDRAEEARAKFEAFVVENHKALLEPMGDAKMILDVVQKSRISAGVVSNKLSDFVNAEVDYFGWRIFFKSVVGAREAINDKPSADPLLLGLKRAGIESDIADIWYVGDTIIDQKCAANAGSKFVYINYSGEEDNEILQNGPDLTFNGCAEFADFLLQWREN